MPTLTPYLNEEYQSSQSVSMRSAGVRVRSVFTHQGEELRSRSRSQVADGAAKRRNGPIIGGQDVKSTFSHSIMLALGRMRFAHGLVGNAMKHRIAHRALLLQAARDTPKRLKALMTPPRKIM